MRELVEDIFLSFSDPPSPIDYVECFTPEGWVEHTDERIDLASRLSLCVHYTGRLRYCSSRLYAAYRRLEDYAKSIHVIETEDAVWRGHGKLLEITLYLKYLVPGRPSWERHYELRMYISVPLTLYNYSRVFDEDLLVSVSDKLMSAIGISAALVWVWAGYELEEEGAKLKVGFREIKELEEAPEEYIPFVGRRRWCDRTFRATYDTAYFVLVDERGYVYDPMHPDIDMDRDEVRRFLEDLYSRVVEVYRYW